MSRRRSRINLLDAAAGALGFVSIVTLILSKRAEEQNHRKEQSISDENAIKQGRLASIESELKSRRTEIVLFGIISVGVLIYHGLALQYISTIGSGPTSKSIYGSSALYVLMELLVFTGISIYMMSRYCDVLKDKRKLLQ